MPIVLPGASSCGDVHASPQDADRGCSVASAASRSRSGVISVTPTGDVRDAGQVVCTGDHEAPIAAGVRHVVIDDGPAGAGQPALDRPAADRSPTSWLTTTSTSTASSSTTTASSTDSPVRRPDRPGRRRPWRGRSGAGPARGGRWAVAVPGPYDGRAGGRCGLRHRSVQRLHPGRRRRARRGRAARWSAGGRRWGADRWAVRAILVRRWAGPVPGVGRRRPARIRRCAPGRPPGPAPHRSGSGPPDP